jgi:hypothetical protein
MPMDTYAETSPSRGGLPEIEPSVLGKAGPERGRRFGRGSGNCANPLRCPYGRCFSNAVASAGGLAESAETPSDDSSRGLASALGNLGNIANPFLRLWRGNGSTKAILGSLRNCARCFGRVSPMAADSSAPMTNRRYFMAGQFE